MTIKLKPCPFCGSKAGFYNFANDDFFDFCSDDGFNKEYDCWSAKCRECGAQSSRADNPPSTALKEWNTRIPEENRAEIRRFAERLFFVEIERQPLHGQKFEDIGNLMLNCLSAAKVFFKDEV